MPSSSQPDDLRALAAAFGIDTGYTDWQGRPQTVAPATLRAVLAAFDIDASTPAGCRAALVAVQAARSARVLPPCLVVREGQTVALPGRAGTADTVVVDLEDGGVREVRGGVLPADLPLGYHRLITTDTSGVARDFGDEQVCALIVTPPSVPLPEALRQPVWGLATQLYSVRSAGSWGTGDLDDLRTLAQWSGREHGADFVLVNPLHAAEVVAPMTASPYLPTTRRFANPLYLRVERIAGYLTLPADVRAEVDRLGVAARAQSGELLDRDVAWAAKRDALHLVFAAGRDGRAQAGYDAYRAREGVELDRFATWCVLTELHGRRWQDWPAPLRDPSSAAVRAAGDEHADRVDFYCWLQWQLDEQLGGAQAAALGAGMRLGVVHDLAVGVSPDGADAWAWQDVLARDVTVGAPPDAYSQRGQNWQQPPWRPDRLAELAYAPLRDLFRAALRHSGGLRIDHIIGLFRLWWIPAGVEAGEGTYVHYDHEALIGILALEAARAGAVIIGEDLGNVAPITRSYLLERGLFGTSILWFETAGAGPLAPQKWREYCLASVTTHDLPPTTGYLAGDHIRLRERLGLLTRAAADEFADAAAERAGWLAQLRRLGLLSADGEPTTDEVVVALHAFLTRTPARMRCVALTDAVGERRTQNQPGTQDEYPNWQIPLGGPDGAPMPLERVSTDPRVALVLDAVRTSGAAY